VAQRKAIGAFIQKGGNLGSLMDDGVTITLAPDGIIFIKNDEHLDKALRKAAAAGK
jgi:hypothetical protein